MSKVIVVTPEIIAIMQQAGLSEAEIKGMEIKPLKKTASQTKQRKSSKQQPAVEYYLVSTRKCKLCGSDSVSVFHMEQCIDNPSVLESVPYEGIIPEGAPKEYRYKLWSTCGKCKGYLEGLSKDMLVSMLLKLYTGREVWR